MTPRAKFVLARRLVVSSRTMMEDEFFDEYASARKLLRAARELIAKEADSAAKGFVELLNSQLKLDGRQVKIRAEDMSRDDSVYVNFINLPSGVGGAGGGAEAENNRMSFWVHGFPKDGAASKGTVKVEMSNSALPREYKLRGKTGTPEQIAKYLSDFINKVVKEVEPSFTHTK